MYTDNLLRTPKTQLDLSYKVLTGLVNSYSSGLLPGTQLREFHVVSLTGYAERVYELRIRLQTIVNDGSEFNASDYAKAVGLLSEAARMIASVDDDVSLTTSEITVYNLLVNDIQSLSAIARAFESSVQKVRSK